MKRERAGQLASTDRMLRDYPLREWRGKRPFMRNLPMLAALLLSSACGPVFVFKPASGVPERAAKPPLCDFAIVSSEPGVDHQKLGSFDIQYDNTGFIDKPETLKRKIQPDMCRVGGDAALGHLNTYGTYIKVTVYGLASTAPESEDKEEDDSRASSGRESSQGDALSGL